MDSAMACAAKTLIFKEQDVPYEKRERKPLLRPGSSYRRRRHSSYQSVRSLSSSSVNSDVDADAIYMKVDLFIPELERRLRWIETYGNLKLDAALNSAFSTLQAVRSACAQVSGELVGAGRRRATILVEILEKQYKDSMPTLASLAVKAQAGMRLIEDFLLDLEARTRPVRYGGISDIIDETWRMAGDGVHKARVAMDEGMETAKWAHVTLMDSIDYALKRAKESGLINYEDLPYPWRVNPHITRGYRFSESKIDCVKSAFDLTNETVNIWSHAIGALIVLTLAFYVYPMSANFARSSKMDIFFVATFFFAACKCLLFSCVWHTMSSISEQSVMERFACVDYTGISLLVAATIITTEYTAFYCDPVERFSYITITAILGIGAVALTWHPIFNRPDKSWLRVAFYVTMAMTGLGPATRLVWVRGFAWVWKFYSPILNSIFIYLAGALVYASKVPERWLHGWFDYFGGSHNIWHMAVLGGILFHYSAMQSFFTGAFERSRYECAIPALR